MSGKRIERHRFTDPIEERPKRRIGVMPTRKERERDRDYVRKPKHRKEKEQWQ